jgi:hypothetical protein
MRYNESMTKLLEEVISRVRKLPEAEQDMAAVEFMHYLEVARDPQLSDAQLAEVERRLANQNPKTLTLPELDKRLGLLGIC